MKGFTQIRNIIVDRALATEQINKILRDMQGKEMFEIKSVDYIGETTMPEEGRMIAGLKYQILYHVTERSEEVEPSEVFEQDE